MALLVICLGATSGFAEELKGQVVAIADGDTFTLLVDKLQHKIRLAEIDAPERAQPWGQRAKQALAEKIFQQNVLVQITGRDRYGRVLGRVFLAQRDVNRELVDDGHAWAYRQYLADQNFLVGENRAREQQLGLWAATNPVAPWDWRRGEREVKFQNTPLVAASLQCGSKRYCREMESCNEARFYLLTCGATRLDGDGDGVPCEKLCQ